MSPVGFSHIPIWFSCTVLEATRMHATHHHHSFWVLGHSFAMHARHAHFMLQMYTLLCSVQVAELYKLFSRWHVHDGNVLEKK